MPSVFLSYSREDLPLIEQLEARLTATAPDISIWRDQEKTYGGEDGRLLLLQAIEAYRLALQVRTKDALPVQWEQTKTNLAEAQKALADMR